MSRDSDPRTAGVQLSARPVGGPSLRDVIARAVDDATADRIISELTGSEVTEELAWTITRALHRAADMGGQRDDIFEWPGNAETAARVAVDALAEALGRPRRTAELPNAQAARAALADVRYLDWQFDYVDTPYPRVTVRAVLPDTSDPTRTFTVTRYAVVDDDVVSAAFRAVMDLHDHEAREHFFFSGERVFNAHREPAETAGPQRRPGVPAEQSRRYTADIGASAGVRRRTGAP
jgi:hypothetical protein